MNAAQANAVFVRRFQRLRGLGADGWAGRQTRTDLDALLGGLPAPEIPKATVYRMFPGAKRSNVDRYLPPVLQALADAWLDDPPMILMALATIRAETGGFVPISEGKSRFNTDPGRHPFNRYDGRTDLGNRGRPDGDRYKGRGFVQLTGRDNYRRIGRMVGADLEEHPELANAPETAAKILAAFLSAHEGPIRQAIADGDLAQARKLVNGGRHGLADFKAAWLAGEGLLA